MEICLVGLPLSGKSALFSALTGLAAAPASTKGPEQIAVVKVPDGRIELLTEIFKPKKKTPATIEFTEIAGLAAGEPKKQGLSERFLARLRAADALLCVVRAFADPSLPHPLESVDPVRDLRALETEFLLSDLAIVEGRMERLGKQIAAKKNDRDIRELALLQKCRDLLETETPLRRAGLKAEEETLVREGTRAAQAAGFIHSDIERGFIRAEVVPYDEFAVCRSMPECRTAGALRLEGKDYPVRDGDIINFRFAV